MPDTEQNGIEYKGEIYGRIWESIAWSKEESEAQRLSNIIFMAAKEDIIADKEVAKAKGEKYTSGGYQLKTEHIKTNEEITLNDTTGTQTKKTTIRNKYSTEGKTEALDKFIATLNCENDAKREELRNQLLPDYVNLKKTLSDVRVLGVGNSTLESIGKACKMICKVMSNIITTGLVVGGVVVGISNPVSGLVLPMVLSGAPAMALSGIASGISGLLLTTQRADLKHNLKAGGFVAKELEKRNNDYNKKDVKSK